MGRTMQSLYLPEEDEVLVRRMKEEAKARNLSFSAYLLRAGMLQLQLDTLGLQLSTGALCALKKGDYDVLQQFRMDDGPLIVTISDSVKILPFGKDISYEQAMKCLSDLRKEEALTPELNQTLKG